MLCLTGCSVDSFQGPPAASPAVALTGTVHGGQNPITGALVYMYAAGTGGYNTAARSMLGGAGYVTTGTGGVFSISNDYTCDPGDEVYLYVTDGNPGLAQGTNNSSIGLLDALGACSNLNSNTTVVVNEVTTIAAAYALSGFMSTPTTLSSSGTALALQGVINAFATTQNLASPFTGVTATTTAGNNGTVPTAEINALGNILADCVNTNGIGAPCSTLMTAATPASGTPPANTAQAALNIAHNPGLNVSTLFGLSTPTAPFQTALTAQPNDWSIAITYTGGGSNAGNAIAVDGLGNIWVGNGYATNSGSGYTVVPGSVSEFSPTGAPLSGATGFTAGLGSDDIVGPIAIDPSNNAWVGVSTFNPSTATSSNYRILKINGAGTLLSPAGGYTGGGISTYGAEAIAFDSAGHLWSAGQAFNGMTQTSAMSELSSTGTAISTSSGYPLPASDQFYGPSVFGDTSAHMWAGNYEFSSNGSILTSSSACGSELGGTSAIDRNGNLWAPDSENPTTFATGMTECNSSGVQTNTANGYPISIEDPEGVTVDGDNRIWYFGYEFSGEIGAMDSSGTSISPASGYVVETDTDYTGNWMAIDGSGNLWIADSGPTLVEFVGVASPVVMPLSVAVANNQLGTRP
jgi:hypothetical protein